MATAQQLIEARLAEAGMPPELTARKLSDAMAHLNKASDYAVSRALT